MDPVKALEKLDRQLTRRQHELKRYDEYLNMEQPLKYMAPALQDEFGDRVTQLVLDLPSVIVEAYESVLDVQGFTLPSARRAGDTAPAVGFGQSAVDREDRADPDAKADRVAEEIGLIWTGNDMAQQMPLLQTESVGLGNAYIISSPGDAADDLPVMSVESPLQVYADRDPRTRKTSRAIKRWAEEDESGKIQQWGTLYLPGERRTYVRRGRWDWEEQEDLTDEHGEPGTRVVPFPNKTRLLRMDGLPEFAGILPTLDAINKMATDMMISGEFHAMPRRFAFGLSKEDFKDENGKQLSTWQQLAGAVWASEAPATDVKVGQFDEADLKVFHDSIKLLLAITFMQVALPSHISAFQGDNPTSEPAIKAAEIQKTKRAERKQTFIGGGLVEVFRNNWAIMGRPLDELRGLETTWRNPATPTRAQEADASVKLVQAKVIPPQQARVDLNYSPAARRQMESWDRENAADPFFERMLRDPGEVSTPDVDGG